MASGEPSGSVLAAWQRECVKHLAFSSLAAGRRLPARDALPA